MNIGFLFTNGHKITGIESESISVVKELKKIEKSNTYRLLYGNRFDAPLETERELFKRYLEKNIDLTCEIYKIDVIHSFWPPFDDLKNDAAKVITINDVIPIQHPEWFFPDTVHYFKNRIRESILLADKVCAISRATKVAIMDCFGVDSKKIDIVYCGLNKKLSCNYTDPRIIKQYGLEEGYILSVCTLEPRKNLVGLIKSFIIYKENSKSKIKLVLTGKVGHDKALFPFLNTLGKWKSDIIVTGYITDELLAQLYYNALAIAYVSFCEGFGLPILEGMAAGKAVISSNTSSMPEVGGDAVCYCNPYDLESIEDAIRNVVEKEEYRKELERRAVIQAQKFSYHNSAVQYLKIYHDLL